jgi:hypothetical protein
VQLERASGPTAGEFLSPLRDLGYHAQTIDGAPIAPAADGAMISVVLTPLR